MSFAVGSLVKARGREWVVLPETKDDLLMVRPLGGTDDETTGILLALESVEPAQFDLPNPSLIGDFRSCRLLRDAVRLGFRSSAGPFRSFARIAVEPRPYQLVPLLMALSLDPIRILIADDVGIGKTIEAGLIARELLDRGEVQRMAVLCPPHLAEQWQLELRDKFHIDAELVLPSTALKLARNCRLGQSLFDLYPYVIVSMDYIKSDARRDEFLRTCPDMVIVDEAHTCASGIDRRGGGRHQRHQLISGLSKNENRHLILVTATPHSGNEEAFRSLLSLLKPEFTRLPEDLTGPENEQHRRELAQHFVQRRRGDIRHFLDADTPFPDRDDSEETYKLSGEYRRLFERVLTYAREIVKDPEGGSRQRQRVRWWSALALLRSMASSPAAAAATLRTRAASADAETVEEADELGRRSVLDLIDDETTEGSDVIPGSMIDDENDQQRDRRRLLEMAREAESLQGDKDEKLKQAIKIVKAMLAQGARPIVFCRFIPTADYVAAALRRALPKDVAVESVTGTLPPADREVRVSQLAESERHVLVATDCLSEGINLQKDFDAILHYDLSWNPTRHEQREGRVDRYGQPTPKVRVVTYYGIDNQIDGIVLDVLIRKHKTIRSSLGISVPVPIDTDKVIEAIFEGVLLRGGTRVRDDTQTILPGLEDFIKPKQEELNRVWDVVAEREKRSRTMFAQESLNKYVDDVRREVESMRAAIGSRLDVESFTTEAFRASGAVVSRNGSVKFNLAEVPRALREAVSVYEQLNFAARFELPVKEHEIYLSRTHPIVEGLASYVMETALDPINGEGIARRSGAIRTAQVDRRTTALLVRFRYHIIARRGEQGNPLLAEDCRLLAFAGSPQAPEWLTGEHSELLMEAKPGGNIQPEQSRDFITRVIDNIDLLRPHLGQEAQRRGDELLDAHRRVRAAVRMRGVQYSIEPQLPPDVLGVYVYLPMN